MVLIELSSTTTRMQANYWGRVMWKGHYGLGKATGLFKQGDRHLLARIGAGLVIVLIGSNATNRSLSQSNFAKSFWDFKLVQLQGPWDPIY